MYLCTLVIFFMKRYYFIFAGLAFLIAAVFFFFRIAIFDGEIVFENGGQDLVLKNKLSLSYFLGIGFHEGELKGVKDFYLINTGYANAFLLILALPALISYRIFIAKKKKEQQK